MESTYKKKLFNTIKLPSYEKGYFCFQKNERSENTGTSCSSRGTLYQGHLIGLWAIQVPQHVRSWVGADEGGLTGGKQGARMGTGRQESLCKRDRPKRAKIGMAGTAGLEA